MEAALVVAIVAAVFAGLAAVFAGWSAWASHRSAGSAESSAHSAAEAVELERDRRHRELTPQLQLEHDGPVGSTDDEEGVRFTSRGPLDYPYVFFILTQDDAHRPIAGFVLGDKVLVAGELGPLNVGGSRFVPLRRPAPDEGAGTLYLRLTCRNDQGAWTIPAQVEIPGAPSANIF
jgi:type II secretory pathway pseudopilin PulG